MTTTDDWIAGLGILIRSLMAIVRWAQKTKERLEKGDKE